MPDWQRRLRAILKAGSGDEYEAQADFSSEPYETRYIRDAVIPAFESLADELKAHGRRVSIESSSGAATIEVFHRGAAELAYSVRLRAYPPMATAFPELPEEPAEAGEAHAEVLVNGEPQDSRVPRTFGRDEIIDDFLDEYEKWANW